MKRRLPHVLLVVLAMLAGLAFTSSDAEGQQQMRLREPFVYFALGDSFASGEGDNTLSYQLPLGSFTPAMSAAGFDLDTDTPTNTCHRSANAYAMQQTQAGQTVRFAACSGAEIADLFAPQNNASGTVLQPAQADIFALEPNTTAARMITLSIGGNDLGFADILLNCAIASSCQNDPTITGPIDTALTTTLQPQLEATYRDILDHPANQQSFTSLVVVGYPRLFGRALTCPSPVDGLYDLGERIWADQLARRLNTEIKQAVDAVATQGYRVSYVDTMSAINGHEICRAFATGVTPWINQFDAVNFSHSFHPNEFGHAAMAPEVKTGIYWALRYV